mmetsp:Transcript_150496/g.483802  ORF Transcript_150496/g.483802 Transcript_150496/m.483802 type:complete len:213 (+) Transcript_150496:1231-1869(+)
MQACDKFFNSAAWSPNNILLADSSLSGALNCLSVSSACRQLAWASAQLPRSHSKVPSFLHFWLQFMAAASTSTSATFRSWEATCSNSRARSSASIPCCASYSRSRSAAACSPPASSLRLMFWSMLTFSRSSRISRRSLRCTCARSNKFPNTVIVMENCMIGANNRFESFEHSSNNSAMISRFVFMSSTLAYCLIQSSLLFSQCFSDRSNTLL